MKWNDRQAIVALLVALLLALAGCSATTAGDGISAGDEPPADDGGTALAETADTDSWDEATATNIELSDSGISVEGDGASAEGDTLAITAGGTYLLSGSLSAGQVVVDAPEAATVRLVLNDVDITAASNAGIYNSGAGTLILTLPEGSVNTVSDAADFAYSDTDAEEPDAAIFSKNNLTVEGEGSLAVTAGFHNGIGAKDDLLVTGGTLNIAAANHGLRGRDSVTVRGGSLTIKAGNDGIQANNDSGEDVGWIALEGGSFDITAGHDGIQAESGLTLSGGTYAIVAGGGAAATPPAAEEGASDSYKGIKAGSLVAITGGDFSIDSADDAVHCNGDIRIDNGSFAIATGDDAVHADGDLTVGGGTINITASYEGLEGFTMTIAGGTIDLVASDDGVNVAGGTDTAEEGQGRFGADQFAANGDRWLKITGGTLTIDAGGDGIDINGNGEMSGGEVTIHQTAQGPDSALDYDGSFAMTGGVLLGAGGANMAQAPGSDSTQPSLLLVFTEQQGAGTAFALTDKDGNTVVEFTPNKAYQSVLVSAPELVQGESYTVLSGGEALIETALTEVTSSISDTGEAVTTGMRGGMGGGMRGPGGGPGSRNRPNGAQPPDGMPAGERRGMPPEGAPGEAPAESAAAN